MSGMIDDAQEQDAPDTQGEAFDAEAVKSQIEVPPDLKEPFQRVIAAGLKVMYDPQTHELAMQQLDGEGATGEKLGKAIAGLLMMLFKESNNTLPPQLIIPAGVYFLADAADFLQQAGKPVAAADVGTACETMLHLLFQQSGMDAEKMYAMLDQMGVAKDAAPADEAAPEEEAPVEEAAPDPEVDAQMQQRANKQRRMKKGA